jgi:hypothetical protein
LKLAHFTKDGGELTRIITSFDPALDGLRSHSVGLHTSERNATEMYGNWNFTDHEMWDSRENGFWYSHETTLLY